MTTKIKWIVCFSMLLLTFGPIQKAYSQSIEAANSCAAPYSITEVDGQRKIALLVGVGDYKASRVPDLQGPANDVQQMYNLLTNELGGYEFPKSNICVLVDSEATRKNFDDRVNSFVLENVSKDDVVLIFFAGHGSQIPDQNDDEADGRDETLVFHDYEHPGNGDLRDDNFNAILESLDKLGAHTTVILDTCNSGSATRGSVGTYHARFFDDIESTDFAQSSVSESLGSDGDLSAEFVPASFDNVTVLTAASDGTAALERNGQGIFTSALVEVLSDVGSSPLTYAQVARKILPLVTARSPQVPYVAGNTDQIVLGSTERARPLAWEVVEIGNNPIISGPTLPGVGKGAEYRIYDGSISGGALNDPALAKAFAVAIESDATRAKLRIDSVSEAAPAIEVSDIAIMVRPGDDFTTLSLRITPHEEALGVPASKRRDFITVLESDDEARLLFNISDESGDFELKYNDAGKFVLYGPENTIRNYNDSAAGAVENLRLHARQLALLQLTGEGGTEFSDNETLEVSLLPAQGIQPFSCATAEWVQSKPNDIQIVPLCQTYNIRVKHAGPAGSTPLRLGGLMLSTDGSIYGLPADGRNIVLRAGEETILNGAGETFVGAPPLDVHDTIMIFGTKEENQVPWWRLNQKARTREIRSAGQGPMSSLFQEIHKYLEPGTRGALVVQTKVEDRHTWTMSVVKSRVEANARFLEAGTTSNSTREYTLPNFNISPYLPDDSSTALHKVLSLAEKLASSSMTDGYNYKQHPWELPTDQQNLKRGIDCSRAIWFAFTRSELPYNRSDKYIPTVSMVQNDSLMADNFQRCDNEALQTGDVLVYRDDTRGDGHTVMVIDAHKRIAWGSHGWDGNGRQPNVEPDTGVEYQIIKVKRDWERWDRSTMERKACWRYKIFEEERVDGLGTPGLAALHTHLCESDDRFADSEMCQ